jgi:hypothetical protein
MKLTVEQLEKILSKVENKQATVCITTAHRMNNEGRLVEKTWPLELIKAMEGERQDGEPLIALVMANVGHIENEFPASYFNGMKEINQ